MPRRVLALSGEKEITVSEALALLKSTGIALVVRIFCRSGETQHNELEKPDDLQRARD
jgi:hypothetical protein